MRAAILLLLILLVPIVRGQDPATDTVVQASGPTYPGGEGAMQDFLKAHFDRSIMEECLDLNGTVCVRFTVTEQGELQDAVILRGVAPAYDAEALRVVRAMPRWEPRRINGTVKPVMITVPVKIHWM